MTNRIVGTFSIICSQQRFRVSEQNISFNCEVELHFIDYDYGGSLFISIKLISKDHRVQKAGENVVKLMEVLVIKAELFSNAQLVVSSEKPHREDKQKVTVIANGVREPIVTLLTEQRTMSIIDS